MSYQRLNTPELTAFEEEYNKISNNVFKYGYYGSTDNNIRPCIRVKDATKIHEVISMWYPAYKVSYIHNKGYFPNKPLRELREKKEISHICGNAENTEISLCIEITHMNLETHKYNISRIKCHDFIRKQVPKYRHYTQVKTLGTIYVNKLARQINKVKKFNIKKRCSHTPKCFINYGKII